MNTPDFPRSDSSSNASEVVPSERFDTADFPPEERLAAFRRLTGPLFDVWAQSDAKSFDVQATGHSVGPFVFTQVQYKTPARFLRSAAHCHGKGSDFLVLEILLRGTQRVVMPRSHSQFIAGHIYLRDWSHEFDAYATALRLNSIVIPRDLLQASADMTVDNPVLSWSIAEPDGRVIAELWSSLLTTFDHTSPAQAEPLAHGFLNFLDGLLMHDAGKAPQATLGAMQQYLNTRLRGAVSTRELCRHFGVSRSKLYRLFEPAGGVRRYITQARLERCYTELLVADPTQVRISDVAASWGFSEASSFTRAFRDYFEVTPSNVLGKAHTLENDKTPGNSAGDTSYCRNYLAWFEAATGAARSA
ncbi:MAG: AraC family transcriptional regulator [Pseudomonadota bacterium]